jgi:hypothetical protein
VSRRTAFLGEGRPLAATALYAIAWLLPLAGLAVLAGFTLWLCLRALGYPYQLLYGEGLMLEFSRRLAAGEAVYKPLSEFPLGTCNYPPLPLLLARLTFPLTGLSFAAGRIWAILAALAVAALLAIWVWRASRQALPAAVAALVWLGAPYVYHWAPQFRVDLLGLAFSLGGVVLVWVAWGRISENHESPGRPGDVPGHKGEQRKEGPREKGSGWRRTAAAIGAAALFVLGLYCKQSFLAGPAAAFLYLLGRDRRSALVLAGAAVVLGGVPFLVLTAATGGAFWTSLISSNVNRFDPSLLASQGVSLLRTYLPLVLLSAAYLLLRVRRNGTVAVAGDGLVLLYGVLALATGALAGKVGSWENYFLEPLAVLCLGAGLGVAGLSVQPRLRWLAPVLVLAQVVLMWHTPTVAARMLREDAAANEVLLPQVASAPGLVQSEDVTLPILAGKPVPYYDFQLTQLALAGRYDQAWEVDQLRRGVFPLVIFEGDTRLDVEKYGRYTHAFMSALDYGYRPAERVGKYRLYRPAPLDRERQVGMGPLALAGYTLPPAVARPGDRLALDVLWQATRPMTSTYTSFVHVLDASGQQVAGDDRQAWQGLYPTSRWAADEAVRVGYTLTLPAELPAGLYTVVAGWYDAQMNRLRTEAGAGQVPLAVVQVPPERAAPPTASRTPVDAEFEGARLAGYRVEREPGALRVILSWLPTAFFDTDYTVFMHLRNAAGETIAYGDAPPAGGTWPTSLWRPGEPVEDTHTIPLPAGLPGGTYGLVAGLYDPVTARRVPLLSGGDEVALGNVQLP